MRYRKTAVIGLVAGVTAGACSEAARPTPPTAEAGGSDRAPTKKLTCANAQGPVRGRWQGDTDAVAGPLRLVSAMRGANYPRRHFRPTRERDFTLKSPLVVAAGASVRIEVIPADRGHVSLMYMTPGSETARVKDGADVTEATACPKGRPTGWVGAIVVDRARCARLRVTYDETTTILRIPLGKGTCGSARTPAR